MAASIGDVATRAGVSVATVSRALRGLPNVAPSTRSRVMAAAEELQYVPDPHASRLAAGRTRTIGMVVPLFTQWFFTQVVAGAEAVLAAAGYDVMLYNVAGVDGRTRFLERMPFRKRVDGILIIELPMSDDELARLAYQEVPVATVGLGSTLFPSVSIDNLSAARTATRHLINLGHESIGLIANLSDDPFGFPVPVDRREGYRQALKEHDLEIRPELDVAGNFSLRGGAEAMAQLMAGALPPTAVFAESDEMAIGALKTVRDAGLRVPEDISIIGFDDHDVAQYAGLTTIAQPVVEQGEVAADLLLEQIANAGRDARPDRVIMPTKLVVRHTTGPRRAVRRPQAPRPDAEGL